MRLKLTLAESGGRTRDVQVTADAMATIGDVARLIVTADPLRTGDVSGRSSEDLDELTLRVSFPGDLSSRLLNPLLLVHESLLRSGCTVEVTTVSARSVGDGLYGLPAALVRVVSGPNEGQEFTISAGVNYVGRAASAQVVLEDDQVSRRHASITVAETIVIVDVNSANGVEVDGMLVDRAILTEQSRILIGRNMLRIARLDELRPQPAGTQQAQGVHLPGAESSPVAAFSRSPRVEAAYRGAPVQAPELPGLPDKARFPILAMVAPLILGVVLFAVTRQVYSLLFIALSPLIMFGTWVDNRTQNRRKTRDSSARFAESVADTRDSLKVERVNEIAARTSESPSTVQVVEAIRVRSPLLWTRNPEHTTFLEVRFGTGSQTSRNSVVVPAKNSASAADWREVTGLAEEFRQVSHVPVIENLARAGAIGIAGSGSLAADTARSLVLQLVGLHSPADVVVTAFGAGSASVEWSWLKWLPHVDSPFSPLKSAGLAGDFASASMLVAELEELIAVRQSAGVGPGRQVRSRIDEAKSLDDEHGEAVERLQATPVVIAIVTAESPADRARLVAVGQDGPDVGVFLIWMAATVETLPVICRTFVEVDQPTRRGRVGFVRAGLSVDLETIEQLDSLAALEAARLLAPVEDTGAQVLDETDLPRQVAFLDLFDGPIADDPDMIRQRWNKNDTLTSTWVAGTQREPGGLRSLVGQGPVEPFYLDLRRHGPHALVGGTTGAGKSEFLQSWIMGLAAEYSPDRVTFLLVDYKGGSAFAECVALPHTVGLVTDLTPHLVRRALTSLRAELKHREALLNRKGAKDLESLERRSDPEAPPVLIIIIDEFAALATEVPDFVDGIIDVAQRGRSLGLHLIMATQRPAGVIKDALRANTNLRIALRVADEADSVDVLGVPSAALFDPGTPGRAAAKLGPGRIFDFQTAFLGGRTTADSQSAAEVEIASLEFGRGAGWPIPSPAHDRSADVLRDIERLGANIGAAADQLQLDFPRRPWLEELPEVIALESLPAESDVRLAIGLVDEPEAQRQSPFEISLDGEGNVAVFGTGGSGKSALLRTVAISASRTAETHPVHIYGLDFAGGGLASLEGLPTVGAVIGGSDVERVTRLVGALTATALERAERFSAAHAETLVQYRSNSGDASEARIIVLLDGMAAFRGDYEFRNSGRLFEEVLKLVAIGRQVGIHFLITADRAAAFPSAMLANIQTKIVLRLAGEMEYSVLGVPADVLLDASPGRGLSGGHEIQFAIVGGKTDLIRQADAIRSRADALRATTVVPAPEIERLAEFIPASTLPPSVDGNPTIGVSDETLQPVGIRLEGLFVVSGPFGSGRTTAMTTIIRSASANFPKFESYLIVARRSALAGAAAWNAVSRDAEEAEQLASRLAVQLEAPASDRNTDLFIVVENVGDFEALPAEGAVARLLKAARRADVPVIVEADTITAASAWQIFAELRTARAGLVLQPEETDGLSLFRTQFPRVTRTDFPVGRGILVTAGKLDRIQVAFPA